MKFSGGFGFIEVKREQLGKRETYSVRETDSESGKESKNIVIFEISNVSRSFTFPKAIIQEVMNDNLFGNYELTDGIKGKS